MFGSYVVITKPLACECVHFHACVSEVTLRTDVETETGVAGFIDIPLIRLKAIMGVFTEVDDEYFYGIPYLKPSRRFRSYLLKELERLIYDPGIDRIGRNILVHYREEIRDFDENASIVRQAKTAVNGLSAKRTKDVTEAREVLKALGRTISVDLEFEFRAREQ